MGDFGTYRDKWVCPNDRQLSLLAKLKSGWSVKSASINSFTKPESLNEKEQEVIRNVIQRAENLDKVEQERVGRLVERLDNMKKNAMGNGTTQCVLCADEFGILGASALFCNDCKKAVCTKCGVDTTSAHKEPLWLCKICSETRETWKKSGAWFYKGLPKYILPSKKPETQSKYGRVAAAQAADSANAVGSPVRSYNSWLQSKTGRSTSDKEFTDSSDEELRSGKIKKQIRRRYLSDSVESNDSGPSYAEGPITGVTQASFPQPPTLQFASTLNVNYATKAPDMEPNLAEGASYADVPESISPARVSPVPSSNVPYWFKPRLAKDPTEEQRFPANEPLPAGYGNGRLPLSPRHQRHHQQQQLQHPQEPHQRREKSPVNEVAEEEIPSPEGASTMEFSMLYDPHGQALHCTILRVKGLRPTHSESLADPFVRLQLLPTQNKSDRLRTRTLHKTLNPEFNETISFFGVTDYDMAKRTLRLTVLDEDHFTNEIMGETKVILRKLRPQQTKRFHVYLDQTDQVERDEEEQSRGQILLSLMYSTEHTTLVVGILRCIQLPPRENTGHCDPYVRVHLKPDHLRRRHKTATKKKTINPEYNEEFLFEMKPHELSKRGLAISVWDKDYGKTDDYIGGLDLGVQSKGERLRHWLDTVRNPDSRIERWHHLSDAVMHH